MFELVEVVAEKASNTCRSIDADATCMSEMSNNHSHSEKLSGECSDNETNPRKTRSLVTGAGSSVKKEVHATFAPSPVKGSASSAGASSQSQGPSTEPSAIVLISPRVLQSQNNLDAGLPPGVHLSTIFYEVDENTQSTISLRVSRGKSQVNLFDPSRTHRRAPGQKRSEAMVMSTLEGDVDPENQIFPSLVMDKPLGNVKAEYDFYTPGQTMENVKDKVHHVKTKLAEMKECLVKIRDTACVLTAIADSVRQPSDDADASVFNNQSRKVTGHRNSPTEDDASMKTNTTGLSEDRINSLSSDGNASAGYNNYSPHQKLSDPEERRDSSVPAVDSNEPNSPDNTLKQDPGDGTQ